MDENKTPDLEEILQEAAEETAETVGDMTEETAGSVSDAAEDAAAGTQEAPAAAPAAGESVAKGKKPLMFGAIAVGVVLIVALLIALFSGSPLKLVATGVENTLASLEKNPAAVLLTDISEGGSVELTADLETLTESIMGFGIEGEASVKLYSSDKPAAAVVGALELEGEDVLDATVLINQKEVAVASRSLLGDKAYGINLDKFAANFEQSVFGPGGDYDLGMEPEELKETLEQLKVDDKQVKEIQAVAEDLLTVLAKSVNKHADIDKGKETVDFGESSCKTTTVSVTLTPAMLAEIVNDLLEHVNSDKALRKLLENNAGTIAMAAEEDPEYGMELVEEFYAMVASALERIDDLREMSEDTDEEYAVTFYISKGDKCLVGVKFNGDDGYSKTRVELFAGPDPENLQELSFRMDNGYLKYKGSYTVKVNDKKTYEATLKVREDNETVLEGKVEWDKRDGDLLAEVKDEYDDGFVLKANLAEEKKVWVLALESLDVSEEGEFELGVTVKLAASDKMPGVGKYTDVLTMSADELEDVVYDIMELTQELSYFLY